MTAGQDERHWFRPRRYGWGARPIIWEGWLFVIVLLVILIGGCIYVRNNYDSLTAYSLWLAVMFIAVFAAISFAKRKTNGPWRFRWGRWRA
jgi:hypothetical protein